ncbi:hypothetical protein ACSVIJ_05415 [Pseudomonas sp. NCHU5208]|uniref:hypothetical protein n=1 Tax=unclassified Pseudomonas TaxID=196821 RepID=UPI003F9BB8BF
MTQSNTAPNAGAQQSASNGIALNGHQLREALTLLAPDNTTDQLDGDLVIELHHAGQDFPVAGLYAYHAACPEEGAILLEGIPDGWAPCSPALLDAGVCCATAPRIAGQPGSGVSHYHPLPQSVNEPTDAQLFTFGCEYGFPMPMRQINPVEGPVFWTYDSMSDDNYPTAREAIVAEFKKTQAPVTQGTAPAVPAAPVAKPESEDLLFIARQTGLRGFIHGVNATDTREMLARFVEALPVSKEAQYLEQFFNTAQRISVEESGSPASAMAKLSEAIAVTTTQRMRCLQEGE